MKFSDYEKSGKGLYGELARLVKSAIETAVAPRADLPPIQAIQARAKGLESLKRKLEMRGLLESEAIEQSIKDLAGIRLILYTNADVSHFLQRRVIPKCLNVHWEETKFHYPNAENDGVKYEGVHFVVSLPDTMITKPEHSVLKGLRCEVQIQTLLAHAFAESSHDIIYKGEETPGFGARAREAMQARLHKIVDDYLRPASFELDKVQADYERLRRGAELFQREELERLAQCGDNEERYDRLKNVAEYLIPHYDDLGSVFQEIRRALTQTVYAARDTLQEEYESENHKVTGQDVTRLAIQIFADLMYVDIEATFQSLIEIYASEPDREVRGFVIDTVEKLASYNMHVWKRAGPYAQIVLAEALARFSSDQIEEIRPLATVVWRALLSFEIDGTTWSDSAITISKGTVPASGDIQLVRSRAIEGLMGLLDRSTSDEERRPIISAFLEATQLSTQAPVTNEMLATALQEMKAIIDRLLPRLPLIQFDLWEHIESHLFHEYKQFKPLADADNDKMGCKAVAGELIQAIRDIRDRMNSNRSYVRYKTLVGFEGVFSQQWDNEAFDFEQVEALRKARAARFVAGINDANSDRWLSFIEKCAATRSNDWATFPIFNEFLVLLGEKKPKVALRSLAEGSAITDFVTPILVGLAKSEAKTGYEKLVNDYVAAGEHLAEVARHYRITEVVTTPSMMAAVLKSAIDHQDQIATIECLIFAIAKWKSLGDNVVGGLFMPALNFLTTKKDSRWVLGAWFLREAKDFFSSLSEVQNESVLDNLIHSVRIDHQIERILACIGNAYPGLVWKFFRNRLLHAEDTPKHYEAIPYQLHDLNKIMSRHPEAALNELRGWYKKGDSMFGFTGGRLLRSVFPTCSDGLASAAIKIAAKGGDDDVDFLLHVFRNYRGEAALHPVAKKLVQVLPENDMRLISVEALLQNTGVVSGEFGMVEAMRERKALMTEWLKDNNTRIQAFAKMCIRHLDNRIAIEQRDAEIGKERRKRDCE